MKNQIHESLWIMSTLPKAPRSVLKFPSFIIVAKFLVKTIKVSYWVYRPKTGLEKGLTSDSTCNLESEVVEIYYGSIVTKLSKKVSPYKVMRPIDPELIWFLLNRLVTTASYPLDRTLLCHKVLRVSYLKV